MRIEKPNYNEIDHKIIERIQDSVCLMSFDTWFERNVEPINKMLAAGVVVYRHPVLGMHWDEGLHGPSCEETALLINIQPTKNTEVPVRRQ